MNCMKCGRIIAAEQVFCEECLAEMEQYPVKPGTPVVINPRELDQANKRMPVHKKLRRSEDRIADLQSWVKILALICVVLLVALVMVTALLMRALDEKKPDAPAAQAAIIQMQRINVSRETFCE